MQKFVLQLEAQLADRGVTFDLSEEAIKWLAEKGYDSRMGARPLGRVIQEHIKQPLADEVLFGKLKKGGTVKVTVKTEGRQLGARPRGDRGRAGHAEARAGSEGETRAAAASAAGAGRHAEEAADGQAARQRWPARPGAEGAAEDFLGNPLPSTQTVAASKDTAAVCCLDWPSQRDGGARSVTWTREFLHGPASAFLIFSAFASRTAASSILPVCGFRATPSKRGMT